MDGEKISLYVQKIGRSDAIFAYEGASNAPDRC